MGSVSRVRKIERGLGTFRTPSFPCSFGADTSEKAIESYFHIFHLVLYKAMVEPVNVEYTTPYSPISPMDCN